MERVRDYRWLIKVKENIKKLLPHCLPIQITSPPQCDHIVFQDFPRQVPQLTRGSRNLTRISPNIIPNFRPTFEINQTEPESQNYYPVASNIVIKVLLLNLPQVHQNLPQAHQNLPQVHQNLPKVHQKLPQVRQIQGIFLG